MTRRKASRLGLVGTSQTIAVKMEADRLRGEGVNIIDFGPGEPDLDSPDVVKEAGIQAIRDDFTHYTAAAGTPELRSALANFYGKRVGAEISAASVIVGVGGKSVIFAAVMALVNPGDEVIIPAPYWVSFPEQVRLAGGSPVFAMLDPEDGFTLRADLLASAITPATRAIIINSPSNPSGGVLPPDEARKIAELVVEHDLWLISDETYESFLYDPADIFSMLSLREMLGERLIFASAFSKSWSMTGWRVGYAIADPGIVKSILTVQSHDTTHTCSIAQKAALAALELAADVPAETLELYRGRRELMVSGLRKIPGLSCPMPRGAFYAYPEVSGLLAAKGLASSAELAKALISEVGLATVPGEAFGTPGFIRLSYACSDETIREGLERLRRFVGGE